MLSWVLSGIINSMRALDEKNRPSSAHSRYSKEILLRRCVFATLAAASVAAVLVLAALSLAADGFDAVDILLLALFGMTTPLLGLTFASSVIGFFIMRFTDDPGTYVMPLAANAVSPSAIATSTAIVMCVRNEATDRVVRNLQAMIADIAASGCANRFHVYVLSDTSTPDIVSAESEAFGELARRWAGRLPVTYRRRPANTGFKAGNIRDFLERWGANHDLMVILDADSYMPASGILRMVGIVEANPTLGILQSLVIGMPSTSAFARVNQFGMRLGMRSWTIGSTWWQADCGPYWGHNAVIRIAPFIEHCAIPVIPGSGLLSGYALGHDTIEAALMRRAGYEVRVLPEEDLGWEENPPTLIEFVRRDLRWYQGTLQYFFFTRLPGLAVVTRFQLVISILMFLGSPAWIVILIVASVMLSATRLPFGFVDPGYGAALLTTVLVMWFSTKAAAVVDVLARPDLRRQYGGIFRFLVGVGVQMVFFLILLPIMWTAHGLFLAGLPLGRAIGWMGQVRDDHSVSWSTALRNLWPQTLIGTACLMLLGIKQPGALPYVFVLWAIALLLAVPFCVVTSLPSVGLALARIGICRLPEETEPPIALETLELPALKAISSD
jgi:membrane glycosyltransferase